MNYSEKKDIYGRIVKVGDVYVRACNRGGKVEAGEKTFFNANLCVVHRITSSYIYYLGDHHVSSQTIGGGLIEKVGTFKKDYDFDENFNLIKLKASNEK